MNLVKKLKWLMWAFRAFSLLRGIKELINFVNITHVLLAEISRDLDELCRKPDNS